MVCLIADVKDPSRLGNTETLDTKTASNCSSPASTTAQSAARIMSMHERVVMLESENTRLRNTVNRLHEQQYYSERNYDPVRHSDIVDIVLIASAAALLIVVGKLVLMN